MQQSRIKWQGLLALIAAAALTLSACGPDTIDRGSLENELSESLAPEIGLAPDEASFDCPGDIEAEEGREFQCTMVGPGGDEFLVEVTLIDDEGGFQAIIPPEQFE